jgi:hypothetical protein
VAADAWDVFDKFKEYTGDGTIDLDGDTFKIVLCSSTSNAATQTLQLYASLTEELSTANGYTNGGAALTSVTWTESAGTVTFDSADPSWTASGGSITARFAVVYDDTPTSPADPLCFSCLMDNSPADVTVTDGNTLTIQIHANGYFQVSGGWT